MRQIEAFQQGISLAAAPQQAAHPRVTQAVLQEQAALSKFQDSSLARVPVVTDSGDLVRFGAVLCGALAHDVKERGMQVLSVEILNHLVRGHYVPDGNGSTTDLRGWPRLSPGQLTNPICVPTFNLPSLELQIRVRGLPSSRVFAFIESLANYPVLVNVTGIDLETSNEDIAFRLRMQSYYWTPHEQEHE
jgi:hypothetical protein